MKITHTYLAIVLILLLNACSSSSDSNGDVNTTPVPLAPSNLTGYAFSPTTIILNWTDNSTDETGFKIERKTGSGTYAVVGSTITNETTFNDFGLTPNTTYSYRVKAYNAGGNSISYSNEFTLSNQGVTDIDGNFYELVTIGTQTWTKRNLTVSHYRNGDAIASLYLNNCVTGSWTNYMPDTATPQVDAISMGQIYGKLYNMSAVTDPRGLAPVGFHIPTKAEWEQLASYLDPNYQNLNSSFGSDIAGNKLKEVGTAHWQLATGTNSSGFTALPGGCFDFSGLYQDIGHVGRWYSASVNPNYNNSLFYVKLGEGSINQFYGGYSSTTSCSSYSIRCIKD